MKVIVEGLATEFQDEGQGPVVLMLHGWGNTLHVFDALVPDLVKSRRVVRLDLPGFGATERQKRPWTVEDYARFVAAFSAKLKLDLDVIVGYSLGGRIIIKGLSHGFFSAHHSVLIAAAGVAKRRTWRNQLYATIAKAGKMLLWPLPAALNKKAKRMLYEFAGSDYFSVGSMSETFRNIVKEDLTTHAQGIRIPTLIIWGDRDTVTPLADGKKLHSLIHDSRLVVVPDAGHFLLQERSHEVSRLMQEFIP